MGATVDASGYFPTTLGGVTVTINGIVAPLLYVSDTPINAVAPVELTPGAAVLKISKNGTTGPDFRVEVDAAAPQVFAGVLNQDGTLNSQSNPSKAGSYVSVWATGTEYFSGNDGQIAPGPNNYCNLVGECDLIRGSDLAPIYMSYVGAAPGLVNGVVQINFQVSSASDSYYFRVDGMNSGFFTVYTTQ